MNRLKQVPLPAFLFLGALTAGLLATGSHDRFMSGFNQAFTGSLGYFTLLLFPSFLLASALSRLSLPGMGGVTRIIAPFAGAGMICPDTAYAALSPAAGDARRSVVMGTYAGFKLLPPAGPLIISAALGIHDAGLLLTGFLLLIPVWFSGELYLRALGRQETGSRPDAGSGSIHALCPFILSSVLIMAGIFLDPGPLPSLVAFLTHPAGALLAGAVYAWMLVENDEKKACIESALGATGRLILLIGLATAFGNALTAVFPLTDIFSSLPTGYTVLALFGCAAVFKTIQGSSMATFAAVAPVVAPLAADISPALAVYSIAVGSFIAILPNDSFYWLAKEDAYQPPSDTGATLILAAGSVLQAGVGLLFLLLFNAVGLI